MERRTSTLIEVGRFELHHTTYVVFYNLITGGYYVKNMIGANQPLMPCSRVT